ncbi:flavohemoglobin expression-modulating QEGLA motif protein [Coxiella burnetii]|uniref:flavohemoglobin expression-modulating QEGLA motif protein n=1 Tax=Coxiella burnetii TaxID=777 RepID=UPI00039E07CF|nr:flavohemoglobin expression-modulating QEGLA motif protein [Coxiella burnetii]
MKAKFTPAQKQIRELSEQIVAAQRPVRILDAVKWDESIREAFFKDKFAQLPQVNAEYYQQNDLGFDPDQKLQEFYNIEHQVNRILGKYSAVSALMQQRCREYRDVIHLLKARGTKEFSKISQDLYGSSDEAFYAGAPTLRDLSLTVSKALDHIGEKTLTEKDESKYTAREAVKILGDRLEKYFGKKKNIHVKVSDNIVADASAGADTIKLREDLKFSKRVIQLYEVHEGWVHLGTTLNGLEQKICTFLSKGPPSTTVIQEGLAILTELFTFSSYPARARRINNRVVAINMAENGANFIDVFNFFHEKGQPEEESYYDAVRIFRGSTPDQGPFTKDLSYSKGFILIYNYIRLAIGSGNLSQLPLLFIGKTDLINIHLLKELDEEGLLTPPQYIPPQFKDLSALSAWGSYSLFLNQLNLEQLARDYRNIL